MPKIYSLDIEVAMTVYINADSEEEAKTIAKGLRETGMDLPTGGTGGDLDAEITDAMINASLPDISFSPAVTIKAAYDLDTLELAYDSDEDPDYNEDED